MSVQRDEDSDSDFGDEDDGDQTASLPLASSEAGVAKDHGTGRENPGEVVQQPMLEHLYPSRDADGTQSPLKQRESGEQTCLLDGTPA